MLVLVDGVEAGDLAAFARCADMFDGNDDDAVAAARERWRRAREAGHALTYWQQTASGWERRDLNRPGADLCRRVCRVAVDGSL